MIMRTNKADEYGEAILTEDEKQSRENPTINMKLAAAYLKDLQDSYQESDDVFKKYFKGEDYDTYTQFTTIAEEKLTKYNAEN